MVVLLHADPGAVIAGCQAAWEFFGRVFAVLIPDNLKPVVTAADPLTPRLSAGWLDYAAHAGFATDAARVASPKDKPRVERAVQYVRGNFWGWTFPDLAAAQRAADIWCAQSAGQRIHGTTCARPAEVFTAEEAPRLLVVPGPYDIPVFPGGQNPPRLPRRGRKSALPRCPSAGSARPSTCAPIPSWSSSTTAGAGQGPPRQPPGGRHTDPTDLPEHKLGYALRIWTASSPPAPPRAGRRDLRRTDPR